MNALDLFAGPGGWDAGASELGTWPRTGPASREAGCGLCIEIATPQTRKRAILLAAKGRAVHPPAPTHQAYAPGEPAQHQHTLGDEPHYGRTLPPAQLLHSGHNAIAKAGYRLIIRDESEEDAD